VRVHIYLILIVNNSFGGLNGVQCKTFDVSFIDSRILSAIEKAKFTVRAPRRTNETYEIDFGYGAFYTTLSVKEGVVTEQTLGALTERIDLLRKVITNYNYTAPMRYGPVSAALASGTTPKAKPRANHA
jgi:hypothetical protein